MVVSLLRPLQQDCRPIGPSHDEDRAEVGHQRQRQSHGAASRTGSPKNGGDMRISW